MREWVGNVQRSLMQLCMLCVCSCSCMRIAGRWTVAKKAGGRVGQTSRAFTRHAPACLASIYRLAGTRYHTHTYTNTHEENTHQTANPFHPPSPLPPPSLASRAAGRTFRSASTKSPTTSLRTTDIAPPASPSSSSFSSPSSEPTKRRRLLPSPLVDPPPAPARLPP